MNSEFVSIVTLRKEGVVRGVVHGVTMHYQSLYYTHKDRSHGQNLFIGWFIIYIWTIWSKKSFLANARNSVYQDSEYLISLLLCNMDYSYILMYGIVP